MTPTTDRAPGGAARRSRFRVAGMDCAAEEMLVRSRLAELDGVLAVDIDLDARTVRVLHREDPQALERALASLGLGCRALGHDAVPSGEAIDTVEGGPDAPLQTRVLWTVLAVNAVFFVVEAVFGLLARSLGLIGDGLDMLADAVVYGMSLAAVGRGPTVQRRVARWAGYGQLTLAGLGFLEVVRRALGAEVVPDDTTMIVVASLALVANVATLALLARARSREAHIRASVIFTSNDVILNLGVIAAAVLVGVTGSGLPDLLIGTVVFAVVARGAWRILALAR